MNLYKYSLYGVVVSLWLVLPLFAKFKPFRYQKFLQQTYNALDAKKKLIESNLRKLKTKKNGAVTLQTSLKAEKATLSSRLKALDDEKKLIMKPGFIKDKTQEDALLQKMTLMNSQQDLAQKVTNARSLEQFLEQQKHDKLPEEQGNLERLKQKSINNRKQLELRLAQQKGQLYSLGTAA